MAETCVRVDIPRLAQRLGGREPVAHASAHLWLIDHGLTYRGGLWHCDGDALRHLRPDEVLEAVTIQDVDGVKFVEKKAPEPE